MIARKIWRHRLITLPVVFLTMCGAIYVLVFKEPVYEAKSSFALLYPKPAPTADQIAQNPALAHVHSDNPYVRSGDASVIIQLLSSTMSSESARRALVKAGADPRYAVAPVVQFGQTSPMVQLDAQGASAASAIRTARLVGDATAKELDRMQEAEGVDPDYRIGTLPVAHADQAELQASGKLRTLVGVLVLGAVVLFMVVSVSDALESLRRERAQQVAVDWSGPLDDAWQSDLEIQPATTNGRRTAESGVRREHEGATSHEGRLPRA